MKVNFTRCLVFLSLLILALAPASALIRAQHRSAKKERINISITGVTDKDVLANINSAIKNIKSIHLVKPIHDDAIYSIYTETPKAIKEAMQPFGYFNTKVKSSYQNTHGFWYMHFRVLPGVRSTVAAVSIKIAGQGADDKQFEKLVTHYPLKRGDYFLLKKYNDGNNQLFESASALGYFDAKTAVNKIIVNLLNHTVKIDIVFDTGKRHYFGATHFDKTPLNIKFIRKYLAYKEGDFYDSAKVVQTQNNLANSNYFSQIIVSPQIKKSEDGYTPMHILLHMRKRKAYTFGLGYGTDTQIRGTLGFKYRWVNSWGHYFDAKAQGSFVNNSLVAAYNIPWPNPVKDLLSLKVGAGKINVNAGKSSGVKASIVYKHSFKKWDTTLSFSYLNEQYDMTNLPQTRARLFYPDANITYYSTKNHINPATGLRFTTNLSGTPNALSSTSGFWQVELGSKAVVSFLKYEQFVTSLAIGRTAIGNINNLPLSLQFLIGGSQTVRGFSYQSIGPGRNMLYGTVELRQRVWNELYFAGFYDFGNVTDQGVFKDMSYSAGPSLVYRSPIGVIELSVAWRLSAQKVKPRIVFSMGPEL